MIDILIDAMLVLIGFYCILGLTVYFTNKWDQRRKKRNPLLEEQDFIGSGNWSPVKDEL